MGDLSLQQLENAFVPAKEVTDPNRFAGRHVQLQSCYLALITNGANLALIGNRGMGKTSLARQVAAMAAGDTTLLDRHRIRHGGPLQFLTIYFTCGREIANVEHLLERILTSHDGLASWVYDVPSVRRTLAAYQPKFGARILGIEVGLGAEKSTEITSESASPVADTFAVFTNVLSALAAEKRTRDGLLIIVDEFDQLRDKTGFASLLKALATSVPGSRFCVVGVAHDLEDLFAEHESVDRLFAGGVVTVPDMTPAELGEIVDIAEQQLGHAITFEYGARVRMTEVLAQGHPYMVHLIGKHALRAAWKSGSVLISATDIDSTLRQIAESGADPILERRYKRTIASSRQREVVLRAFAEVEKGGEVWTADAYQVALHAGVDNPSHYVAQLLTEEFGAEVVKVRERFYRFRDSLFRTYVSLRPQLHEDSEVG